MRAAIFILFIFCQQLVSAQDFIYKKDNTKIPAKVTEINTKEIKYLSLPDSIPKTISKNEVAIIIYKDGSSEVIKTETVQYPENYNIHDLERQAYYARKQYNDSIKRVKKENNKNLLANRKNYLYWNVFEVFDGSAGISYSRNIFKNHLFVHVPLSIGVGTPAFSNGLLDEHKREYFMNTKIIDLGLGINYYIVNKSYASPFIGFLLRYARFNGEFNWYAKNNNFVLEKYYYLLHFGVRIRATNGFTFMPGFCIGSYLNNYKNPGSIQHYDILSRYNEGLTINISIQFGANF